MLDLRDFCLEYFERFDRAYLGGGGGGGQGAGAERYVGRYMVNGMSVCLSHAL